MSNAITGILVEGTWQTLEMVLVSCFFAYAFGMPLGILLFVTRRYQVLSNPVLNKLLGAVVNVVRSIPFIILMVAIIPLTRLIVGTSIGTAAAIVPLTVSAIPFVARLVESALAEVAPGLIEASEAMGATATDIVRRVLLSESWPGLIRGITLTLVTLVGYSAMAGAVGGGGLGDIAIQYGYNRFDIKIMIATIVILVILVQVLQWGGDLLVNYLQTAKKVKIKRITIKKG